MSRRDPNQGLSPSPSISSSPLISFSISILTAWLALAALASPARAESPPPPREGPSRTRAEAPSPTRAEAPPPEPRKRARVGGLFQAFGSVQALSLDGRTFVDHAPYQAAGLRFKGEGLAVGGGFSILSILGGARLGIDANFFVARRVELAHGPLGPDLQASLSPPIGVDLAATFGYELDYGPLHPYLDLRFGASFLGWSIDVHSTRLGDLTALHGTQTFPIVAPRLGIAYRFEDGLNLDIGTSATPFGLARAGVFFGLGGYIEEGPPPSQRNQSK